MQVSTLSAYSIHINCTFIGQFGFPFCWCIVLLRLLEGKGGDGEGEGLLCAIRLTKWGWHMHCHALACPNVSQHVLTCSFIILTHCLTLWSLPLPFHFGKLYSRETANTAALNIYLFVQHTPSSLLPFLPTLHTPFGWIRTCVCDATGLQKDTPGQFAVLLISLCKGHKTHNEQTNKQTDRPRDRCMDRQRQQHEGIERDCDRGGGKEREKGK